MVRMATVGSSVEGEKVQIETRQFHAKLPARNPITKRLVYNFKLGIHGSAEITECYGNPDVQVVYSTSLKDVGDVVHGTSLTGWAIKPLKDPHVKKATGTHSGSFLDLSGGCFVSVDIPPRDHLQSQDVQERHAAVSPALNPDFQ